MKLDNYIYSHGVDSFMGNTNCEGFEYNLNLLKSILGTDKEICAAESPACRKLGDVGVYLKGHVSGAYTRDMNSWIDDEGHRQIPQYLKEEIEKYQVFKTEDLIPEDSKYYCEIHLQPTEIVGYWVKKNPAYLEPDEIEQFIELAGGEVEYV